MRTFDGIPQVRIPIHAGGRLLQLRIYESHSHERSRKKIQMFNQGGELAIFSHCGMTGVLLWSDTELDRSFPI